MEPHREGGGSFSPRTTSHTVSSAPAIVQRSPPISAGGIVSSETRMPR